MRELHDNLPTLLVVEDEKNTREGLRRYFDDKFDIYLSPDAKSAIQVLEAQPIELLLTDLRLSGGTEGMDLLMRAKTLSHPPVCILMTAYGSEKVAVEAMKAGAYDYITKPLDLEKLEVVLQRALRSRKVEAENVQLRQELDKRYGLEKLIGNAPAMVEVYELVKQVAPTRASVLIEGESGTGKELIAQSIHQLSPRKPAPFVPVHCAALSAQLLESELFGHEKGAFTGATERRIGRFEEANHGTIFLDEIGEIDATVQVKLLRALGEQTIQRVGGNQVIKVDVRVVAATNRSLEKMVQDGTFREDLFFRLQVVPIHMPPLRDRKEDIPLLAAAFVKEYSKQNSKKILSLNPDVQEALIKYDWPGNVRELRSSIEYAVVMCRGERISVRDLPARVIGQSIVPPSGAVQIGAPGKGNGSGKIYVSISKDQLNLEAMEKTFIEQALKFTQGNVTEAAQLLGISRRTLHRKLLTYHIAVDDEKE
jgi:DNA-binding NtrC family response regulator